MFWSNSFGHLDSVKWITLLIVGYSAEIEIECVFQNGLPFTGTLTYTEMREQPGLSRAIQGLGCEPENGSLSQKLTGIS